MPNSTEQNLTHIDEQGSARRVDVGNKAITERIAVASGRIVMNPDTLALIVSGGASKGDVLGVARIAGIQAAKRCSDLIPLCHPLALNAVELTFEVDEVASAINIQAMCKVSGKTGVEMEALTAASVAALTIYDMCKAVDRGMQIDGIRVEKKAGGKSGDWERT